MSEPRILAQTHYSVYEFMHLLSAAFAKGFAPGLPTNSKYTLFHEFSQFRHNCILW